MEVGLLMIIVNIGENARNVQDMITHIMIMTFLEWMDSILYINVLYAVKHTEL